LTSENCDSHMVIKLKGQARIEEVARDVLETELPIGELKKLLSCNGFGQLAKQVAGWNDRRKIAAHPCTNVEVQLRKALGVCRRSSGAIAAVTQDDQERLPSPQPLADAEARIEDLTNKIVELTAVSARLYTEIKNLEKEVTENQAAYDKATAIREKQFADFFADSGLGLGEGFGKALGPDFVLGTNEGTCKGKDSVKGSDLGNGCDSSRDSGKALDSGKGKDSCKGKGKIEEDIAVFIKKETGMGKVSGKGFGSEESGRGVGPDFEQGTNKGTCKGKDSVKGSDLGYGCDSSRDSVKVLDSGKGEDSFKGKGKFEKEIADFIKRETGMGKVSGMGFGSEDSGKGVGKDSEPGANKGTCQGKVLDSGQGKDS